MLPTCRYNAAQRSKLIAEALDANFAGSLRLSFPQQKGLLRFYALCSRINHTLFTYGDQGLFIKKDDFERIGGFKPLPFLEDIEIQKRLRSSGSFAKLPAAVITSDQRFKQRGPLTQQSLNIAIVSGFLLGISPEKLARYYPNKR